MPDLLAVDVGLRTGLARYGPTGRLLWYRSQNYGSRGRLQRAVPALLDESGGLGWLVLEGGGDLATIWSRHALRRGIPVCRIAAEVWRRALLLPRQQRAGVEAKHHADAVARRVIAWSGAARPTHLRHDAAEAILAGLWGAVELGILPELPPQVRL